MKFEIYSCYDCLFGKFSGGDRHSCKILKKTYHLNGQSIHDDCPLRRGCVTANVELSPNFVE